MTSKESQGAIDHKGCEVKTPSANKKKSATSTKKNQGALDPKEYEAKTLWLTKTKEAAKSTYVYG